MIWENLTVDEFAAAEKETKGVVLVPIGCLEKHGNHMPLGTDILIAREISIRSAEREPAMVFPYLPFGIVAEVKHKQGTISLTSNLMYHMLEELCDELARNGYRKIVFVDGHGGNINFLKYFMQSRLEKRHPYAAFYYDVSWKSPEFWNSFEEKFGKVPGIGHADVFEASSVCAIAEEQMHMERVNPAETRPLGRLDKLSEKKLYTGIGWYADHPAQIAGDPTGADRARGEFINELYTQHLAEAIKAVKEDTETLRLLDEFYTKQEHPEGF